MESISHFKSNDQVYVTSLVRNNLDIDQRFIYLVQVKNSDGVTVDLSWTEYATDPNKSTAAQLVWKPESKGVYEIEILVWDSLEKPEPLYSKPPRLINDIV